MRTYLKKHKYSCTILFLISLLSCSVGNAWRGGGGGFHGGGFHGGGFNHGGYAYHGHGYYHGGGYYRGGHYYNGYYNGGNWYGGAAIVGGALLAAPLIGGYYGQSCSYVQHCYANGNCVQQQVCQ
ncbi:MAG: hypothetical protein NTW94_03795 [Legionellales bacterium]|nr:hypothetical protein [Legionellales bacterium]